MTDHLRAVAVAPKSSAYLFEAKGIQRWVLEGGRLRDIAASSNLLARAASSDDSDILQEVLDQTGFTPEFSRRAGGAFMLHYSTATEDAQFARFRALWRLTFMQIAPGLEYVESFGHGDTPIKARENAYDSSLQKRHKAGRENSAASLMPLGHPFAALAQRTGRPATETAEYEDDGEERIDLITGAKRKASVGIGALETKFCQSQNFRWPDQMEADRYGQATLFPFEGDEQWIAVVHADISALGEFYKAVGSAAAQLSDASAGLAMALGAAKAIESSLIAAAQKATEHTLLDVAKKCAGIMPARPVLLGGDDVTMIVRGDLALPFINRFLIELEDVSEVKLKDFADAHGISTDDRKDLAVRLTATAGIAFGKSKQPFFRLLDLAESLCGFAKKVAKAKRNRKRSPSLVAFHRVTESALVADAGDLIDRLTLTDGRKLTMQPYRVGSIEVDIPRLDQLEQLKQLLYEDVLKSGALRELRSLLLQDLNDQADEALRRWCVMAKKHSGKAFAEFEQLMLKSCGNVRAMEGVFASDGPNSGSTPLFDALEWRAIS
jgi:hypothetical protein